MEINLQPGLTGEKQERVTDNNTAIKYGSGDVPVFATPALVGLMEGASINAVDKYLPDGFCTVGISICTSHTAATPIGLTVTARAELVEVDGRRLVFKVEGFDEREKVGEGTHERFIVQMDKFMRKNLSKQNKN
jgi:fluoroacetyl-CoA thioesterase